MSGEVYLVVQTLAAMAFFGLALLLVVLRFKSRVNRSFAFVVLLLGLGILLQVLEHLASDAGSSRWVEYWGVMFVHMRLAVGPAILYFVFAYLQLSPLVSRIGRGSAILLGGIAQVWFALDHCAWQCAPGVGSIIAPTGPLLLLTSGVPAYMAATGLLMFRESRRSHRARSKAARLMALAFLLHAAFDSAIFWGRVALDPGAFQTYEGQLWPAASNLVLGVTFVGACGGLARIASLRQPMHARIRIASFSLGAVASGVFVAVLLGVYHAEDSWEQVVVGAWRTTLPALAVFALLRHRLFGMEVKVRRSVARATILLVFLALFFTVSKMAELYVSESGLGWYWGGLAAGLLLLALHPLEKLGERVCDFLLLPESPGEKLPEELRLQLYEDMARTMWEDGVMDGKERILLDNLRLRLRVTAERAMEIERGAIASRSGASG